MIVEGCNELVFLIEDFLMPAYNYLNYYLEEVIIGTLEEEQAIITWFCVVFMIAIALLYLWWIFNVLEALQKEVFLTENILAMIPLHVL